MQSQPLTVREILPVGLLLHEPFLTIREKAGGAGAKLKVPNGGPQEGAGRIPASLRDAAKRGQSIYASFFSSIGSFTGWTKCVLFLSAVSREAWSSASLRLG